MTIATNNQRPVKGSKGAPIYILVVDQDGNPVVAADVQSVTVRVKKPSGSIVSPAYEMSASTNNDLPAADGWWYFLPSGVLFDAAGTWAFRVKVTESASAEFEDAQWRKLVVYDNA